MRRLSGIVVAGVMLMLPAFSLSGHAQEAAAPAAAQPAGPAKTTYTADAVIIVYSINQGKDAEYEQVIAKLREALGKSTAPEAKQQLAGWKVVKSQKSLTPDGLSSYIHIINPVVKGADYNITGIVYSVSTDDEKLAFYNLYKGALRGAISQILGLDVTAAAAAPAAAAPPAATGAQ